MVAAYLPSSLETTLRQVTATHIVKPTHSWGELTTLIQCEHVDAAFVDPQLEVPPATDAVIQLIEAFRSVAVVMYTTTTPGMAQIVYTLAQRGLHGVLLHRYDDEPERIAALLERIPQRRILPLVLYALRNDFAQLPGDAQQRLQEVFESPMAIHSVDHLARYVGVPRTRLYELLEQANLGTPWRFLTGAKLLRVYMYMRDPGHTFNQISEKTGWSYPQSLRDCVIAVFGVPPRGLRTMNEPEDIVSRVVSWIRTGKVP